MLDVGDKGNLALPPIHVKILVSQSSHFALSLRPTLFSTMAASMMNKSALSAGLVKPSSRVSRYIRHNATNRRPSALGGHKAHRFGIAMQL